MVPCCWLIKSKGNEMKEKKKYNITIEETVSQDFVVFADDDEEAKTIAIENYKNEKFVLEPGNLEAKQMQIRNLTDHEITEWIEF